MARTTDWVASERGSEVNNWGGVFHRMAHRIALLLLVRIFHEISITSLVYP